MSALRKNARCAPLSKCNNFVIGTGAAFLVRHWGRSGSVQSARTFARHRAIPQKKPNMKLNELKKVAAQARQNLQLAESRNMELQRKAKAAKALAEQARMKHKHARKAAKQAKQLALAAKERARDQLRTCEKAQKRLAKALKKLAKDKAGEGKKPSSATAVPRKATMPKRRQPTLAAQKPDP